MNAQSTALAERREPRSDIDVLKVHIAKRADEFRMVLPAHISVDKFQRTVATAALSNPQLLGCDRQSFLLACMKLAQDGLLPDGREAALVPFKTWNRDTRENVWQVQPMPMAWGLRKKILQSGEVVSLETGLVYRSEMESGHFIYEIGLDPPIRHRPKLDMTDEEMADEEIIAAYSIARLKNEGGDPYWSVEVMRRAEINKVRQASQTGALGKKTRDGKPIPPKGPWVEWFGEMARKTVLRRHSKVLPMSGDIIETIDRDREEELQAEGAARMLDAHVEGPKSLPSNAELDEQSGETINPETGEVTGGVDQAQRDSRGMTEVDEETARRLDAGHDANEGAGEEPEQREAEDQPEAAAGAPQDSATKPANNIPENIPADTPDADYTGPKPANAQPGETWWDSANGKLRHAHQTANGIKWYLNPPAPAEDPQEPQQQASPDDPDAWRSQPHDEQPAASSGAVPWQAEMDVLIDRLEAARTPKDVTNIDADYTNKTIIKIPDDHPDRKMMDRLIGAAMKRVKGQGWRASTF